MEKRDLYDKNKVRTGKTIFKGEKIPDGNYIIVVLTMIQNSKGEFLIQKRSKLKDGLYGATGGHAKAGETGLEGAISEVREEIGVDLKKDEMNFLYESREDDKQVFFELYYAKKDLDISKLKLQEEEVESVEWMDIDKIDSLVKEGKFLINHVEEVYRTVDILKERSDLKWKF